MCCSSLSVVHTYYADVSLTSPIDRCLSLENHSKLVFFFSLSFLTLVVSMNRSSVQRDRERDKREEVEENICYCVLSTVRFRS